MSTRILRRIACVVIAVGTGVLWMPSSANANMRLELASGGQGVIVTDTNNIGALTATAPIGAFVVNVTTGTSSPPLLPPPGVIAELDLNSLNVHSGSSGTITIILQNSYAADQVLGAVGSFGGTISNGTVTATAYVDPTNAVPITADDQATVGTVSVPAVPASASAIQVFSASATNSTGIAMSVGGGGSTGFTSTGTFSMYEELIITFNAGGGTFSGDLDDPIIPEPSSLAIAGIGALGMIGYGLRRRKALGV